MHGGNQKSRIMKCALHWATVVNKESNMNKHLKHCLERTINKEFVSVRHDYDNHETTYSVPYNASLAPQSVKLKLIHAMGLDYDEAFDDKDAEDIEKMSWYLIADDTPEFGLTASHFINKRGIIMTHYILDFDGEILYEKSYPSDQLNKKNPMLQLIRKCSNKIVAQEQLAQEHKMEKMFISMNMFNLRAPRGKK